MKLRGLAPLLALSGLLLTSAPVHADIDYRAPIASALAADGQYAAQIRDQLGPVIVANAAERSRVVSALTDSGSERKQAAAEEIAQSEENALAALGTRLQTRQANLDALAGSAAQQLAVLYDSPVDAAQAAYAGMDAALVVESTDGLAAAYDEARQALADRGWAAETPRLAWPEQDFQVSQPYGPTDFDGEPPYAGYDHFHMGVDLAAPEGTPVLAPADGVVVLTGADGSLGRYFGYGNHIVIAHGGQVDTIYGHLDEVDVKAGDAVQRGQRIGLEGSTGYSTGPHLHFEVHAGGQLVDPATFLG